MQSGGDAPLALASAMPKRADDWEGIRAKYRLVSPSLGDFVGLSFQYADSCFAYGDERHRQPALLRRSSFAKRGFMNSSTPRLCCESGFAFFGRSDICRHSERRLGSWIEARVGAVSFKEPHLAIMLRYANVFA
jgi:hypothetical protein